MRIASWWGPCLIHMCDMTLSQVRCDWQFRTYSKWKLYLLESWFRWEVDARCPPPYMPSSIRDMTYSHLRSDSSWLLMLQKKAHYIYKRTIYLTHWLTICIFTMYMTHWVSHISICTLSCRSKKNRNIYMPHWLTIYILTMYMTHWLAICMTHSYSLGECDEDPQDALSLQVIFRKRAL